MSSLLKNIEKQLQIHVAPGITCTEQQQAIVIEGLVNSWDQVIAAGKRAAKKGFKGVVNKLQVKDLVLPPIKKPLQRDEALQGKQVDVLIIGGGVIGSAIARELSKWKVSILLVEKEEDLAMHTSSRNDGMIHPGIEPKPGSKKAIFNVRGNEMYTRIAKELDVPLRRSGTVAVFDDKLIKFGFPVLKLRGLQNGVKGIRLLSKKEVLEREPYVTSNITGGIFFPSTAILSPYKMTIAFAENALMNGAEVSLNTIVLSLKTEKNRILSVDTNRGTLYPKIVINAAGVYADQIAAMAKDQFFTIHPRKGQILLLDKKKASIVNSVISKPSLINVKGVTKGGGIVKTIEGNILIGPDAYEQPYREDYSTNSANIEGLISKHFPLVPNLSPSDIITYFAGIRASTYEEDFIIERSENIPNLIHAAGIQSPGLASAPAIAEEIEKITCTALRELMDLKPKTDWNPIRKGIPELNKLSQEERNALIKNRPDYGTIVCRCEEISKGEILDAVRSPIHCQTVDGVKRRVRASLGRCQGGFCTPYIVKILQEETKLSINEITKKGNSSCILSAETKKAENA